MPMPMICNLCDKVFVGNTFFCSHCIEDFVDSNCTQCGGTGEIKTEDGMQIVYEECQCVTDNWYAKMKGQDK